MMAWFIILQFYCLLSKLIGSNTLQNINKIQLNDQNVNLTIWVQIRYAALNQLQGMAQALRIVNQDNLELLQISLFTVAEQQYTFCFQLQNESRQFEDITRKHSIYDWEKITIRGDICLYIKYKKSTISICNDSLNSTLYIMQHYSFQLFVNDQEELENEVILLSNIFQKTNGYSINTLKNNLIIKFYVKFFSQIRDEELFVDLQLRKQVRLFFYYSDSMGLYLINNNNFQQKLLTIQVNVDQWILFGIQFNQKDLTVHYNINNTNNLATFNLRKYINFTNSSYLSYQFWTNIMLRNSKALSFQYLQLISLLKDKNYSYCAQQCQFCLMNECWDYEKPSLNFQIRSEIMSSSYYNEQYFENYQYRCNKGFYFFDGKCYEFPKYRGQFCYSCNNLQSSIDITNYYESISVTMFSYDYYLESRFEISINETEIRNGLFYETDLNIYVMKRKDLYLTFVLLDKKFCEEGYYFDIKCHKKQKMCTVQIPFCLICQQQHALVKNKCIKCQKNCIYCKIAKKQILCILVQNRYYRNLTNNKVQQCNKIYKQMNCLPKQQVINILKQKNIIICQSDEIYDIDKNKCQDIKTYTQMFKFLSSYPNEKTKQEQNLDIQYILISQSKYMDDQLDSLISFQQVRKLTDLIQQYINNQSLLVMNRNFELLNQMNTSIEEISLKKIILQVQIFLGKSYIIIYENKNYTEIIDIYFDLQIQYHIVQFDILIIQYQRIYDEIYAFEIVYELFENVTFIFNIQYDTSPTLLYMTRNYLFFKAHQIFINNLLFNFKDSDYHYQRCVLTLKSEKITITNLLIQNQKIINLFDLFEFNFVKISNIWIVNSSLEFFITAITFNQHSRIEISNIYSQKSNLSNFMVIKNVNLIVIKNIVLGQTKLNGFYFDFDDKINTINVYYLQFISTTINDAYIIDFLLKIQVNSSTFNLSNVYFQDSIIINSSLFNMENIYNFSKDQLYLKNVSFEQSNIINLKNIQDIRIKGINIKKLLSQFLSPQIYIQEGNQIVLQNIYVSNADYYQIKQFIAVIGHTIEATNLTFHTIQLKQSGLIYFQAHLQNITNLFCIYFVNQISLRFTIDIYSLKQLSIYGIHFKTYLINRTQLLKIHSHEEFKMKNFSLCDIYIFNENIERLILIKTGSKKNYIEQIYMEQVKILNEMKIYNLFQLIDQNKMTITNFTIKNVNNESPSNAVNIIDNKLYKLEIHKVNISDTNSINFIVTSSNVLIMHLFEIKNYQKYYHDQESLIQHKSTFNYDNETIYIKGFEIEQFCGIFLLINTETNMNTILEKLSINKFINIYSLLCFFASNRKNSKLYMTNLNITNQLQDQLSQQTALIVSTFDELTINQVFIQNICAKLFFIYSSYQTSIIDVYITQYKFKLPIIEIQNEMTQRLKFSNITITNAQIPFWSVFDLDFQDYILDIQNIKFINLSVIKSLFVLISSGMKQQTIKISDILVKNVVSHQILFQASNSMKFYWTTIIGGSSAQIFGSNNKIGFSYGLIAGIKQQCQLSQSSIIYLNQSEIVNSSIQRYDKLIFYKSQFLGIFANFNQYSMMALSLDNGKSFFNQKFKSNIYQVYFYKNNSYLYLPSGRDINQYHYFNFCLRQYTKLYDSISYISHYQDNSTICVLQQNFQNQTIFQQDIIILPGVNIIHNLTFTLNPHYKDQYIELDLICNQNESKITYRTLIKTFNCQLGEFLYKDQCIQCNIEQFSYSVGYNQQYCLIIDSNPIEKLKVGQIKLFKTYWRHSYANKYIEQCKSQNCLGGWQTGDMSCLVGYVGALCSECDLYNVHGQGSFGKTDNQCSLCQFDYSIYLKGLALVIFQFILIYVSYYSNQQQSQQYLFLRISKRKFTEILLRQNVNQVTILLKLYYNYIFTLYLLKDFINFGQFVDVSLNIVYNPGYIAIPQFDCLINKYVQYPIQYTSLIQKILLPLVILNLIVILYTILIKLRQAKYSVFVIIVCLLTINQQNQQIILQSLIKLSSPVRYSNIYWTAENLNIQFYNKIHQHYLIVLIIPLILLITIINILVFIWIRFINKRFSNHLKLSLFIYKQYKSQFYYWEYLRLLFNYLFMVILYRYDNTQIVLLNILFLTLTGQLTPFELQNFNRIDQLIQQFQLYSYFCILVYQKDNSLYKYIVIILSNLILFKLFMKHLFHSFNSQFRELKIKYLKQIANQFPRLKFYVSTQIYDKNNYYYYVLKQSRKRSNATLTTIIQNAECKSNPYLSFEVEMTQIHVKQ